MPHSVGGGQLSFGVRRQGEFAFQDFFELPLLAWFTFLAFLFGPPVAMVTGAPIGFAIIISAVVFLGLPASAMVFLSRFNADFAEEVINWYLVVTVLLFFVFIVVAASHLIGKAFAA